MISNSVVSMDKKYKTRDGRDVRLLCVDAGGERPVIALIGTVCYRFDISGESPYRERGVWLQEIKPRIKREVWLVVWKDSRITMHEFKGSGFPDALACIKVEIDCEEGFGL